MDITEDEEKFIQGIQYIAKMHGFEIDIDYETKTFSFDGPEENELKLAQAIQRYYDEVSEHLKGENNDFIQ